MKKKNGMLILKAGAAFSVAFSVCCLIFIIYFKLVPRVDTYRTINSLGLWAQRSLVLGLLGEIIYGFVKNKNTEGV